MRSSRLLKLRVAIFTLFLLIAGISCASHKDVAVKSYYTRNKMIFLAGLIAEYKGTNGHPPQALDAIRVPALAYLQAHPDFAKDYLDQSWAASEIPLFDGATGRPIHYKPTRSGAYFLYYAFHDPDTGELAESALEGIKDRIEANDPSAVRTDLFFIVDGNLISGYCPTVRGITLENMHAGMKAYHFRGHEITF
jgi:hypothetical protein